MYNHKLLPKANEGINFDSEIDNLWIKNFKNNDNLPCQLF